MCVDHRRRQRRGVACVHQHDPSARGVGLLSPQRVGGTRGQAKAAVHAVRDQRRAPAAARGPTPRSGSARPSHGQHARARTRPRGSKRSLTRRMRARAPASWGPQTSSVAAHVGGRVEHHAGRGRQRVAQRRQSLGGVRSERDPREPEAGPSDNPRVERTRGAQHVGELCLHPRHAHDRARRRPLAGALGVPQLRVGIDRRGIEAGLSHARRRRARRLGRSRAPEARQDQSLPVLPSGRRGSAARSARGSARQPRRRA